MGDSKFILDFLNYNYKSTFQKYLVLTLFVLVLFILFSGMFGLFIIGDIKASKTESRRCGDGTIYNSCSDTTPYFCSRYKLIDLASICGCPKNFSLNGESCFSSYQTEPKTIYLNYTLEGKNYALDFVVYGGLASYISKIPRSIHYSGEVNLSRDDFKLNAINEEEQRKFILPLVIKIQNITNNTDDQVRIAISIVQNIPFGASNKTIDFWGEEINYSRYPYEVLYDSEGICGEKTDLLLLLLREMGYNVSFFYYQQENHEALGIKCPAKESLMDSGYCFVETTGPSIITDNKISYVGVGKLYSTPDIYIISDGKSLGENLQEYKDARRLIKIRSSIEKRGLIGPVERKIIDKISLKYGLVEKYYG